MHFTWFDLFFYLHISAVAIWLGGAAAIQFFALRALRSDDPVRTATFASDVEWFGMRILVPASLVVVLMGVSMVLNSNTIGFGDDWVIIGLVLFAVTFLAGAVFFGPESGRIAKLIEAEGPTSPAVGARVRRILALSRADLVLLFLIAFNMVAKPTFSSASLWIAVVLAVVLATLLVYQGLNAPVAGQARTATG